MRRPSALLASILVPFVMLAPSGAAHAIPADFAVAPFAGPLPFEGETATDLTFDYRCSGMSTAPSEPNMSVRFAVASAPAWARLRVEPEAIDLPECTGVGHVDAKLFGSADRGAVSLEAGKAIVNATWSTSSFELVEVAQVRVETPFVAAFDIEAPMLEATERPQMPVVFPVTFTSRATGAMKLAFEVVDKSASLSVPVPNPVTLQGPGGAQRSATIPFVVQTPYKNGFVDEEGTVTFRVTPSAALDPSVRGEPQEIMVKVHTKGFYMPGPQLVVGLAALALAAAFTRRPRR